MDQAVKSPKSAAATHAATTQVEIPDNINKIREIIFGAQMRDYERRFDEVSSRFSVELGRMKSDVDARLERLESLMRQSTDDTVRKLQQEKRERGQALEAVTQALQEARKSLSDQLASLDEDVAKSTMSLRNDLHSQANAIGQRFNDALGEVNRRVDSDVGSLRADKVARHDLGEMLAELALRLKGEFELPIAK